MKKYFNISIFIICILVLLNTFSQCTKIDEPILINNDKNSESISELIKISFSTDNLQTKSEITDNETGLLEFKWESGDKLSVFDGSKYCGDIVLTSGAGTERAKFEGEISVTVGAKKLKFYYFGHSLSAPITESITVDFMSQIGDIDWVENHMIASCETEYNEGDTDFGGVFNVAFAVGRFTFSNDDFTAGDVIRVRGLMQKITVNKSGDISYSLAVSNDCANLTYADGQDYYIVMPAGKNANKLSFFNDDCSRYKKYSSTILNNIFYHSEAGDEIQVIMENYTGPEFIDLGVTVLWANMNLGATTIDDSGNYYAWGEIAPYFKKGVWDETSVFGAGGTITGTVGYNWKNYTNGSTTFVAWPVEPYESETKCLIAERDAANATWGECRMPTDEDWNDLLMRCTWEYLTSGTASTNIPSFIAPAKGYLVIKGKDESIDLSKFIFLPFAGYYGGVNLKDTSLGKYWSNTLVETSNELSYSVSLSSSFSTTQLVADVKRCFGLLVRPVREKGAEEEEFVDLGLSVKWAKINVGADAPEDNGDYFAWAESTGYLDGKRLFNKNTYQYYNGTSYTKYNSTDKLTVIQSEDDPATRWNDNSRVPTAAEWAELVANCTKTRTTINGIGGIKFTSNIEGFLDEYIFIPYSGFIDEKGKIKNVGLGGYYWTSTRDSDVSKGQRYYIDEKEINNTAFDRTRGRSVRAVMDK